MNLLKLLNPLKLLKRLKPLQPLLSPLLNLLPQLIMQSFKQNSRRISFIVLHCTATDASQRVTVEDLDRWHRKRGWQGCGYHIVVYQDGSIHYGRPLDKKGAHVENHNDHSIGVCYVGGLRKERDPHDPTQTTLVTCDTRTQAQKETLRSIMEQLHRDYPQAIILGHRDLSPDLNHDGCISPNEFLKQCPCLDAMIEYQDLQPTGLWEGKPIYP